MVRPSLLARAIFKVLLPTRDRHLEYLPDQIHLFKEVYAHLVDLANTISDTGRHVVLPPTYFVHRSDLVV
jgi:hypothetical protein